MIAHDPLTHGAMLVPVIAGSDKTTVSVTTSHQEYHPVYISPGIFTNTAPWAWKCGSACCISTNTKKYVCLVEQACSDNGKP
jgi:Plavaka transposase